MFIGCWIDEDGKNIVIKNDNENFLTDFYNSDSTLVERELLGNSIVESKDMKSFFDGEKLIVELGTEGLGPTLKLKYNNEDREYLIPAVEIGLYDDWEDDFGVPWVFPLALYFKI